MGEKRHGQAGAELESVGKHSTTTCNQFFALVQPTPSYDSILFVCLCRQRCEVKILVAVETRGSTRGEYWFLLLSFYQYN